MMILTRQVSGREADYTKIQRSGTSKSLQIEEVCANSFWYTDVVAWCGYMYLCVAKPVGAYSYLKNAF